MGGAVIGLDWGALMQLVPDDVDRQRFVALMREWEIGMLEGMDDRRPASESAT